MIRAIIFLCLATPAAAQDAIYWGNGASHIRLQPTEAPGAVAELHFQNEAVHIDESPAFDLTMHGLTVTVETVLGRGTTPDTMTAIVPEGLIAVPQSVDVPEGESRVITIYTTEGVGM